MTTGSRLVIEDEVDERLMRSQARIQDPLSFRFGDVRLVSVDAPTVRRQESSREAVSLEESSD
jgi:hypothetical protein